MFIGHYGPAAALAGGRIPLWHAAVAVQFLDILWALLVLLGIEHARIVPGFTAANAFDLYDMPWTHSLPMALLWSAAAAAVYGAARRAAGVAGAAVIGALVFSHWALDWLTHRPDLLLWFGGPKAGLGLWNDRMLSFALEIALYAGGFALYLARTFPRGAIGRLLPLLVMALALAAQIFANFGPPPKSPEEAAHSAILAYAVFIALAIGVDASRAAGRRSRAPSKL